MQDFTRPSGRLRKLPFAARLVYSVFLAFALAGLGMTGWLAQDMLGADLSGLQPYYAGETEHAPQRSAGVATGGPVLDVPAGADLHVAEPMPLRKLLEVTHFHLFSMPVYLMVLSHLFLLCTWGELAKLFWVAVGSLSVVAHLAAPWLVRAHRALGPIVYGSSGLMMTLAFLIMAAIPLWEMWRPSGYRCGLK